MPTVRNNNNNNKKKNKKASFTMYILKLSIAKISLESYEILKNDELVICLEYAFPKQK